MPAPAASCNQRVGLPRRLRPEYAFTLIELLVVILIIGVLLAIAAPAFLGQQNKAYDSEAKQKLAIAYKQAKILAADNEGSFVSVSAVQSQINAGEPELRSVLTAGTAAPGSIGTTGIVYVVRADTSGNLVLAIRSRSGSVFSLTVTGQNAPLIASLGNASPAAPVRSPYCPTGSPDYCDAVALTSGIMSWWRMGDSGNTLTDVFGNVNLNITSGSGAVIRGVSGAPLAGDATNTAWTKQASNQGYPGNNAPSNYRFVGNAPFSLEFWVNYENVSSYGWMFATSSSNGTAFGILAGYEGVYGSTNGVTQCIRSGTTIQTVNPVNVWLYMVCTYDGSTLRLYKNTVQADSASSTMAIAASQSNNNIDMLNNSSICCPTYPIATMDEVALYNRALSPSEIQAHYQAALGRPFNTGVPALSGSATQGYALTTDTGTWLGNGISYSYRWERCDSNGNGCSTISGETNPAYTLTNSDPGYTIRAIVTAANSYGSSSAATPVSAVVSSGSSGS